MGFMATTIIILAFLVFFLAYIGNSQKNDSFIFHGFRGANLSMDGSSNITSNGLLQLTNQKSYLVGHAFYPHPINMLIQHNSSNTSSSTVSSFSTSFVFGIIPSDGEKGGGHGFTFAISPASKLSGSSSGQYLGLFNGTNNGDPTNHVFAVEFDTVGDGGEFEEPDHVGINVNTIESLAQKPADPIKMEEGKPIKVWIEYDGVGKYINVTLSDQLDEPMPSTPFLSVELDLSKYLINPMHVGFSASTGRLATSSHYILGWSFRLNGTTQEIQSSRLPSLPPGNFIFHGFQGDSLSMDGSSIITPGGLLQLTDQTGDLVGHAFYPYPINMLIQDNSSNTSSSTVSSFSTSFVFGIIPSDVRKGGGHGFAFAISPASKLSGGSASYFLGLFNKTNNGDSMNHVFAVEFDTVGAAGGFGDLGSNHVGIDVNSMDSRFQETAPINMEKEKPIKVWIEYHGVRKFINVTLSDQLDEPKPSTPLLSRELDLSNVLIDPMYVGFSASTGKLASSHYILGWSFRLNGKAQDIESSLLPSLPLILDMHPGWDVIIVGVSSGAGGLLLSLFLLYKKIFNSLCHWIFSRFTNETKNSKNIEVLLESLGCLALQRYKYSDIMAMTKSFKHKLGQGGYGSVFKGTLRNDGRLVAIKVLNESKGNGEEFINEVATIGKTNHVNVVTLLGFCIEGNKRALVYEYMSNGSLERFIYNEKTSSTQSTHLGWEKLYQIALGIAKGLEYLHCGCNTRILHFDIKPHNILLDKDFFPKISDFGLAKLCLTRETIVSMVGARGTLGYIAPEISCRNLGGVSHKSDVYSYGMMVLEMIGGRKNLDVTVENMSEIYFPHWIYNQLKRDSIVEEPEVIKFEGPEEILKDAKAKKMIIVALWCIQTHPASRPSMTKVVEMLEGSNEELQMPPNPSMDPPSS